MIQFDEHADGLLNQQLDQEGRVLTRNHDWQGMLLILFVDVLLISEQ